MQRQDESAVLITAFKNNQGIIAVCPLLEEDHESILDFELDAEKRSLMGLGKVINTGVVEVLKRDLVFVALTDMDFDWGRFLSALTSGVPATAGKPKHGPLAADDCYTGPALKPRNFLNHADRRTWA